MIIVLRLNHRRIRDKRVSTHVGLVSRALGADKIIYTGDDDTGLFNSIKSVVKNWGGAFNAGYASDYKRVIIGYKKKGYLTVHLTMYGLELEKEITKLRKAKNLLIIVGGEKVPADVYELSDLNVSVTNQPHSEIAALALLLDHYYKGNELNLKFKGGKKIKPNPRGKTFY
jgi:tRNA (cytidine56-2'-O)-methyltransferase